LSSEVFNRRVQIVAAREMILKDIQSNAGEWDRIRNEFNEKVQKKEEEINRRNKLRKQGTPYDLQLKKSYSILGLHPGASLEEIDRKNKLRKKGTPYDLQLEKSYSILGLRPGASLQEVNQKYNQIKNSLDFSIEIYDAYRMVYFDITLDKEEWDRIRKEFNERA